MKTLHTFSINLRILRNEKGFTQKQLADKLLLSRNRISDYENATSEPSLDTLTQIADYFNVSIDFLLGHSELREPSAEQQSESERHARYIYSSLIDMFIGLSKEQRNEFSKNMMRYARFLKKEIEDQR